MSDNVTIQENATSLVGNRIPRPASIREREREREREHFFNNLVLFKLLARAE